MIVQFFNCLAAWSTLAWAESTWALVDLPLLVAAMFRACASVSFWPVVGGLIDAHLGGRFLLVVLGDGEAGGLVIAVVDLRQLQLRGQILQLGFGGLDFLERRAGFDLRQIRLATSNAALALFSWAAKITGSISASLSPFL